MPAAAVQRDLDAVRRGERRPGGGGQVPGRQGRDVLTECDVHLRNPCRQPVGHHPRGPVDGLLGGLEQRDKRSAPMLLGVSHQLRRTQQTRHMHVVPARVRDAVVGARVRQAGVLGERQGVHVGAQQHTRAVAVAQHAHHPGTADTADHLEAGRRQPVGGLARCAVLLVGQLGVAVQVPVEVLLPTADLIGACEDGGYGITHRTSMASSPRPPLVS